MTLQRTNNLKWHILYCDASMNLCPITDFIESCQKKHQIKILRFLDLLEEMGPTLTRPYADILREGIHELRLTLSGDHARFLYFFCFEKYIILYIAFWKHTDRVPKKFINKTIHYRTQLLEKWNQNEWEKIINAGI